MPSNVAFEIEDANENCARQSDAFDFIHARTLAGNILNWGHFFREAYRCCKPGGCVESQETPFAWRDVEKDVPKDSACGQWEKIWRVGGEMIGRTFRVVEDDLQVRTMEETGFVDITVKDVTIP